MPTQYAFTDYAEKKALDAVFNDPDRTYTMALYTVAPTETTSGTEVSTVNTGYSRQPISFGAATGSGTTPSKVTNDIMVTRKPISFGAATGSGTTPSKVTNDIMVTFGSASSNWGTVTGIAIFDDLGNMLVYGTLEASQTVAYGNKVEFAVGAVEISLD